MYCPVPMMHSPDRPSAEGRACEALENLLAVLTADREGFLARVSACREALSAPAVPEGKAA